MWALYSNKKDIRRLRSETNKKVFSILNDIKEYSPFNIYESESDLLSDKTYMLIDKILTLISNLAARISESLSTPINENIMSEILTYNIFRKILSEYFRKISEGYKLNKDNEIGTKYKQALTNLMLKLILVLDNFSKTGLEKKIKNIDEARKAYVINDLKIPDYEVIKNEVQKIIREAVSIHNRLVADPRISRMTPSGEEGDQMSMEEYQSIITYEQALLDEYAHEVEEHIEKLASHLNSVNLYNANIFNIHSATIEIFKNTEDNLDDVLKKHFPDINTSFYQKAKSSYDLSEIEKNYTPDEGSQYIVDSTLEYYALNLSIDIIMSKVSQEYNTNERIINLTKNMLNQIILTSNSIKKEINTKISEIVKMIRYINERGSGANTRLDMREMIKRFVSNIIDIENTKYVHARTCGERTEELFSKTKKCIELIYSLISNAPAEKVIQNISSYDAFNSIVKPIREHFSNFEEKYTISEFLSEFPLLDLTFFSLVIKKLYGREAPTMKGIFRRVILKEEMDSHIELKEILEIMLDFLSETEKATYRLMVSVIKFYVECLSNGYYLIASTEEINHKKIITPKKVFINEENESEFRTQVGSPLLELYKICNTWIESINKLVRGVTEYGYSFAPYDLGTGKIFSTIYNLSLTGPDVEMYRPLLDWNDLPHLLTETNDRERPYRIINPSYMSLYYEELHLKIVKNISVILDTYRKVDVGGLKGGFRKKSIEGLNPLVEFAGTMAYLTRLNSLVLKNTGMEMIERIFTKSRLVQFKKILENIMNKNSGRDRPDHNEIRSEILITCHNELEKIDNIIKAFSDSIREHALSKIMKK